MKNVLSKRQDKEGQSAQTHEGHLVFRHGNVRKKDQIGSTLPCELMFISETNIYHCLPFMTGRIFLLQHQFDAR